MPYTMTLRYALRDYIYEKRTHLEYKAKTTVTRSLSGVRCALNNHVNRKQEIVSEDISFTNACN